MKPESFSRRELVGAGNLSGTANALSSESHSCGGFGRRGKEKTTAHSSTQRWNLSAWEGFLSGAVARFGFYLIAVDIGSNLLYRV